MGNRFSSLCGSDDFSNDERYERYVPLDEAITQEKQVRIQEQIKAAEEQRVKDEAKKALYARIKTMLETHVQTVGALEALQKVSTLSVTDRDRLAIAKAKVAVLEKCLPLLVETGVGDALKEGDALKQAVKFELKNTQLQEESKQGNQTPLFKINPSRICGGLFGCFSSTFDVVNQALALCSLPSCDALAPEQASGSRDLEEQCLQSGI